MVKKHSYLVTFGFLNFLKKCNHILTKYINVNGIQTMALKCSMKSPKIKINKISRDFKPDPREYPYDFY